MSDIVIAIPIILGLSFPFIKRRMWKTVGLMVVIAAYDGLCALLFHQTVSQEMWAHFEWRLVAILAVAFTGLLVHFAWKRIRGKG